MLTPLLQSLAYGWRWLCSRKLYIAAMVVVPVAFAIFFVDLMKEGLPLKVPVSVVDLDQSQLSRRITRNLNATELIDITHRDLSYSEAARPRCAVERRSDSSSYPATSSATPYPAATPR